MKTVFSELRNSEKRLHSCYRGVANLIQLMAGRVDELWNVSGLAPLTFFLEPIPTPTDNHNLIHRPLIASKGILRFRLGITIPK
jgi:hypothetical protein